MALVPFRTLGPAADQSAQERLFQVGGFALTIRQHPQAGLQPLQRQRGPGASEGGPSLTLVEHDTQPLAGPAPRPSPAVGPAEPTVPPQPATRAAEVSSHAAAGPSSSGGGTERTGQQPGKALPAPGPADPGGTGGGGTTSPGLSRSGTSAAAGQEAAGPSPPASARAQGADAAVVQQTGPSPEDHLGNVGLVTWQCGFLLAELLLRRPPLGAWTDVRVLDLGCGCGLVGIALAVAGAASVTLTDLPHVLPLARENVALNCERFGIAQQQRPRVLPHAWGDAESAAALLPQPDLITAADVLYDPTYHGALLSSLELLCAPHTLVYVAWKKRHKDEESFLALAETRGFAVEQVPQDQLAEEYREGPYAVLRLCRLEPMELD